MEAYEEKGSEIIPIKELDLFYTPPTEAVVDLKHTYLQLKIRILKTDGSATGVTAKVAPVNMTLHSMFTQVDLFLNQKLTSSVGVNYPYKAMLDSLLKMSREESLSTLQAEGFFRDSAGFMDATDPLEGGNEGLSRRFAMTSNSSMYEVRGPLSLDISQQSRFVLNEVEAKVTLWPSKDAFVLMIGDDDTGFKMEIVEAVMSVCKINVNPSVIAAHALALQTVPAMYPYEKSQIKTVEVSSGKSGFDIENVFLGDIPRQLVMVMVDSDAYRGHVKKNPFNFKHNHINWLSVKVDDENVPFQAVRPTFRPQEADLYTQLYRNVIDSRDTNKPFQVDIHEYGRGYSLFVYELLPRDDTDHFPLMRRGNLKIQATFIQNLAENTTVLCYGKFPSVLKIDSSRDVIV